MRVKDRRGTSSVLRMCEYWDVELRSVKNNEERWIDTLSYIGDWVPCRVGCAV